MQVNNNSKTPQTQVRQRPLQHSMFLPQHRSPQNSMNPSMQQNQGEFQLLNPLKRSLIQNPNSNNFTPQYQFRTQVNQSFTSQGYQQSPPVQGQFSTFQQKKLNQHQLINHSLSLTNIKSKGLIERNTEGNTQLINKNFSKIDKQPPGQKRYNKINDTQTEQQYKIIQIVNLIKEKYLPGLFDIIKKELHEEINTVKVQFNRFKEQFKTSLLRLQTSGTFRDKTPIKKSKQYNNESVDFQKQLSKLEGRLKNIQTSTNQNFTLFGEQLDKISQFLNQEKKSLFKISQIKSSLPAVMLQYKQLFIVKKKQNQPNKRINSQQIMLSICNYFVDRQGYLMDNENHYLVDIKGNQIRLQDKHLKLLQIHKILQK